MNYKRKILGSILKLFQIAIYVKHIFFCVIETRFIRIMLFIRNIFVLISVLNGVKIYPNIGVITENVELDFENRELRVDQILSVGFAQFNNLNISCDDKVDVQFMNKFKQRSDKLFESRIKSHLDYYYNPTHLKNETTRPRRDALWHVIDTTINIIGDFIIYNKIQRDLANVDKKINAKLILMIKEISTIEANSCTDLRLLGHVLAAQIVKVHIEASIEKLDSIIYSIINSISYNPDVHYNLMVTCLKFNRLEICNKLVQNNKIGSQILAIEQRGLEIKIQQLLTIPIISNTQHALRVLNIGIIENTQLGIMHKSIIGLGTYYVNNNFLDTTDCTFLKGHNLLCYMTSIKKFDPCMSAISNNSSLESCSYESIVTDQTCLLRDFHNFYVLAIAESHTILPIEKYGGPMLELKNGTHLLSSNFTRVLTCNGETTILHPAEIHVKIYRIILDIGISSANLIDNSMISQLRSFQDNNVNDRELLLELFSEIGDFTIGSTNIVTLSIVFLSIIAVLFVAILYFAFCKKTSKSFVL